MAKPITHVTPDQRVDRWKKLWATPRLLDDTETELAFEEFQAAFVPSHMHKRFMKIFGVPKAVFGNRFFMEDAVYHKWDSRLAVLGAHHATHVEVTVIYGSPDKLEAHWLRGETRRTLRDIVIDDWFAACFIVRSPEVTMYGFIEPKMQGCVLRVVAGEEVFKGAEEEAPSGLRLVRTVVDDPDQD